MTATELAASLRAAANAMEKAAVGATDGPWQVSLRLPKVTIVAGQRRIAKALCPYPSDYQRAENAHCIAANASPDVVARNVAVLRWAAEVLSWVQHAAGQPCGEYRDRPCTCGLDTFVADLERAMGGGDAKP